VATLGTTPDKRFSALLKRAEDEGMNYHDMFVLAASAMKRLGRPPEEAIEIMNEAADKVSRRQPATGEIERAVNFIYQSDVGTGRQWERPSDRVKINRNLIAEFASKGNISELQGRSGPIPTDTKTILNDLYGKDELLHLAPDIYRGDVKSQSEWLSDGVDEMQFICPANFKDRKGGRLAENVDYRKYVVFETDDLPNDWDGQAGLLERLAQVMPLRMVVWSGGKSLHGWYSIETRLKDKVQKFYDLAVQLGGDKAVLRPAQLVRVPNGIRQENGKVQKTIYYDRRRLK
jgi:hypothetical protein